MPNSNRYTITFGRDVATQLWESSMRPPIPWSLAILEIDKGVNVPLLIAVPGFLEYRYRSNDARTLAWHMNIKEG
ncbi:hypothetical protein JDV02_001194 [Purpureocillium takamizusanense]|uniref:Uncharacterized protein n=1 Tax=Purpureocillium takamizusanense TaxID=2060973 RepID=A0A9Q8Q8R5_9HYPO|nr:uncharacterized protein JDV02_001194 [Purpureocillium takamizusanense]UNI14578.1 hypothetical protein JDV02_001194 [Purpureocillium takamizusanense]